MTRQNRVLLAAAVCLAATLPAQTPPGACILNDAAFTTQEGGCKDLASTLVWSIQHSSGGCSCPPVVGCSWSCAMTFAANLVEGGYSDWRLPTKAECQEAFTNGAGVHLNLYCPQCSGWTSTEKGKPYAYMFRFDTGVATVTTKVGSSLPYVCVRQGGSGFRGGSNPTPPPPEAQPEDEEHAPVVSPPIQVRGPKVTHFVVDGRWTAAVELPAHAGDSYCMLIVAGDPKPAARMAPLAMDSVATLGTVVTAGTGRLDGIGRAELRVDVEQLGVPSSSLRDLQILLVIAGQKGEAPELIKVRLPG